jgi:hypothetical protein
MRQWCVAAAILILLPHNGSAQPLTESSSGQPKCDSSPTKPKSETAEQVALCALELLHSNQLPKLFRERFSYFARATFRMTEAKVIDAYTSQVMLTPGSPTVQRVISTRSSPVFPLANDARGEFCFVVVHSEYPAVVLNEEVDLVREGGTWKVATILCKPAL